VYGTLSISPNVGVTGERRDPVTVNTVLVESQIGTEFLTVNFTGRKADRLREFLLNLREEEDVD
jgi:hypothetical protein